MKKSNVNRNTQNSTTNLRFRRAEETKFTKETKFITYDQTISLMLDHLQLKVYLVLLALTEFPKENDTIGISIKLLSEKCGISESKVYKVLNELESYKEILDKVPCIEG